MKGKKNSMTDIDEAQGERREQQLDAERTPNVRDYTASTNCKFNQPDITAWQPFCKIRILTIS